MDGFRRRLAQIIELRAITPYAAGELAGMKRGHINHVLSGARSDPHASTLLALALALDVTTDWLLTGEGPIERPSRRRSEGRADPRASRLKAAADKHREATTAEDVETPARAKRGERQ